MKVSRKLKSGIIYVNCWGANQAATPFGGYKQSGLGRELGAESLDEYLETKTVILGGQR
jgi:acyl-CoA reductase-like NAD-dependent aldehyde dehydrogenase